LTQWTVTISDDIVRALAMEFQLGPLVDDQERRLMEEEVVDYLSGVKVDVFANEHPPPHFRVWYQGKSDTFDICTGTPLDGDSLMRFRRNIRKWHAANRENLVDAWNRLRPTDCPVGPVKC
jgi:hypothetical protein